MHIFFCKERRFDTSQEENALYVKNKMAKIFLRRLISCKHALRDLQPAQGKPHNIVDSFKDANISTLCSANKRAVLSWCRYSALLLSVNRRICRKHVRLRRSSAPCDPSRAALRDNMINPVCGLTALSSRLIQPPPPPSGQRSALRARRHFPLVQGENKGLYIKSKCLQIDLGVLGFTFT